MACAPYRWVWNQSTAMFLKSRRGGKRQENEIAAGYKAGRQAVGSGPGSIAYDLSSGSYFDRRGDNNSFEGANIQESQV